MQVGDVMYIRTTGEAVYVLAISTDDRVEVRRPAGTREHGIVHHVDKFLQDELMTKDEARKQAMSEKIAEYKDMMSLQEMMRPEAPEAAKLVRPN